jgi:hypothetical protein
MDRNADTIFLLLLEVRPHLHDNATPRQRNIIRPSCPHKHRAKPKTTTTRATKEKLLCSRAATPVNCAGCDLVGVPLHALPEHAYAPVEVPAVCRVETVTVDDPAVAVGVLLVTVELNTAELTPPPG